MTPSSDVAVLISGSEDVKLERAGQESPVFPGLKLKESDMIRTAQGMADIQTRGGGLVRLRQYTSVTIGSLLKTGDSAKTSIELKNGMIFAKANKKSASDEFMVVTPTSIASVRGTSFSVSIEESGDATVQVFEGKVAVKPSIPALRQAQGDRVEFNIIEERLNQSEEVLEAGQTGSLGEENARLIASLDSQIKVAKKSPEKAVKQIGLPENTRMVRKAKSPEIDNKTRVEMETMVPVSEKTFDEATRATQAESPEKANTPDPAVQQRIETERKEKLQESLKVIEERTRSMGPRSEADMKKEYSLLETVTLKDGSQIRGAVMTQVDGNLVVDTVNGIVRVKLNQVLSIELQ